MRYVLLTIFCLTGNILFAQNWAPINTTDIYNYKADTASAISHSLWIDSVGFDGTDSIFYPNRIVKHISNSLALKNQPQFLNKHVTAKGNGLYLYNDPTTISYYSLANLNDSYTYDSTNNITAIVVSTDTAMILGNLDSIKTLALSSGDTIIASKNHGFVQYPIEYGSDKYYRLVGIEGRRNLGEHVAKFDDFFNYSIGDTFWYYMFHWAKMWNEDPWSAPPVYEAKYAMIIDSIYQVGDTVFLTKSGIYAYPNPINGTKYIVKQSSLDVNLYPNETIVDTFTDGFSGYMQGNFVPNDVSYNTPYLSITENSLSFPYNSQEFFKGFSSYKRTDGRTVKLFNQFYGTNFQSIGDTLLYQKGYLGHKIYIEGLGMTKLETNAFESGATIVMYAYRKAGDSSISILDQYFNDLVIGIDEPEATNFKLLGNPITNTINLQLETTEAHSLTLYNLSGQKLLQQLTNDTNTTMDVAHLPSGMYLLEVKNANGTVGRQRLVKL